MPKMLTNTRSWAALDFIEEIGKVVHFLDDTMDSYRQGPRKGLECMKKGRVYILNKKEYMLWR